MRLAFRTNHLRQAAEDLDVAIRAWGPAVAARYHHRVAILRVVASLDELFTYRSLRTHPLRGGLRGRYAIDLVGRWRLIITITGDAATIEEVSNHYDD